MTLHTVTMSKWHYNLMCWHNHLILKIKQDLGMCPVMVAKSSLGMLSLCLCSVHKTAARGCQTVRQVAIGCAYIYIYTAHGVHYKSTKQKHWD